MFLKTTDRENSKGVCVLWNSTDSDELGLVESEPAKGFRFKGMSDQGPCCIAQKFNNTQEQQQRPPQVHCWMKVHKIASVLLHTHTHPLDHMCRKKLQQHYGFQWWKFDMDSTVKLLYNCLVYWSLNILSTANYDCPSHGRIIPIYFSNLQFIQDRLFIACLFSCLKFSASPATKNRKCDSCTMQEAWGAFLQSLHVQKEPNIPDHPSGCGGRAPCPR